MERPSTASLGGKAIYVPYNGTMSNSRSLLRHGYLRDRLQELHCLHMLDLGLLLCGMFPRAFGREIDNPEGRPLPLQRYTRFVSNPAWRVLASCAYDERSIDHYGFGSRGRVETRANEGETDSPFGQELIAALSGNADIARLGGDKVITANELITYLENSPIAEAQSPRLEALPKHDKGEYVFLMVPEDQLDLKPVAPPTAADNPYIGLETFTEDKKHQFLGRRKLTDQLFQVASRQPFTAVLGASGSGKSEPDVQAGLIPKFRDTGAVNVKAVVRPGGASPQCAI